MADEHFSSETIQQFFRSELTREQNRGFVRHLLRQCPQCRQRLQQISGQREFRFLIRALEEGASEAGTGLCLMPEVARQGPGLAKAEEVQGTAGGKPSERQRAWLR